MPKGGARSRSGPEPDPQALRRERDKEQWTRLPKECPLDVPEWPIEFGELSMDEQATWDRLWRTPQAVLWHRDGMIDIVCTYLRALMSATQKHPGPGVLTALRLYSSELLLSTSALRRERFYIEGGIEDSIFNPDMDQPLPSGTESRQQRRMGTDDASVVRGRFKVIRPQDDDDDDSDPRVVDE